MEPTVHELMMLTKAHEYLIAIGFLIAFTVFWNILFRAPRKNRHE